MKIVFAIVMMFALNVVKAQDVSIILKEALNSERALKEDAALEKYKAALSIEPDNVIALVKSAELNASIGDRQEGNKEKKIYYASAREAAQRALALASDNVDALYVMALSSAKMSDVETDKQQLVGFIRDAKNYAEKALAINPNHAKANYVLGKWHFDLVQQSWAKKALAKTLLGGLPDSKIEDAFLYMEKCKLLDQYFVANYFELAKAYKYDNKPAKAIAILEKLAKLPNRTANDATIKAAGKKMLDGMM